MADAFGREHHTRDVTPVTPGRVSLSGTDVTDMIVTLVDANAKMAETISAQADQIVSLSKRAI